MDETAVLQEMTRQQEIEDQKLKDEQDRQDKIEKKLKASFYF